MMVTMRSFRALSAAAIAIACVGAKPAESVQELGISIRDRFIQAAERCGLVAPFVPKVVVDPSHSIDVHYSADDRAVHLTDWQNLDEPSKGAITVWAAKGTLKLSPEGMYREMFNSFIVPHELGHYLQDVSGRWRALSRWDAELEANRIGVAFWIMQRGAEGRVAERITNISRFTDSLPNPTPAGRNAKDFFNENYDAFNRGEDGPLNPMTYSWYQAEMMKTALIEAKSHPFCQFVVINKPKQ